MPEVKLSAIYPNPIETICNDLVYNISLDNWQKMIYADEMPPGLKRHV